MSSSKIIFHGTLIGCAVGAIAFPFVTGHRYCELFTPLREVIYSYDSVDVRHHNVGLSLMCLGASIGFITTSIGTAVMPMFYKPDDEFQDQ